MDREQKYNAQNKARVINGINLIPKRNNQDDYDQSGSELLKKQLDHAIQDGISFIIVEVKTHSRAVYKELLEKADRSGYHLYGIDIFVDTKSEFFKEKVKELQIRHLNDLAESYMYEMRNFPMPRNITMVDPSSIIPNSIKIPFFISNMTPSRIRSAYETPESRYERKPEPTEFKFEAELIRDFMSFFDENLLKSEEFETEVIDIVTDIIMQKKPKKTVMELHLEKVPSIEIPADKVIDYEHEPIVKNNTKIVEFHPIAILEYNHIRGHNLLDMIDDVDLEGALEEKRLEIQAKKVEFYKQFEDPERNEVTYPSKWIPLEVERQPATGGKRKKKKTQKILGILKEQSVNTVQKGVKKMKIYEKKDSADSDMDYEDAEDQVPYYIYEILAKVSVPDEYKEQVMNIFTKLDQIREMSLALQIAAQVDHLTVKFLTGTGTSSCYNQKLNSIEIYTQDKSENEVAKELAHQLMHCAVYWTFKNGMKPYCLKNDDKKDELQKLLMEIDIRDEEVYKGFRSTLARFSDTQYDEELPGIFGELLVDGAIEGIKKIDSLWKFFEEMMKGIEKFATRFKNPESGGVL